MINSKDTDNISLKDHLKFQNLQQENEKLINELREVKDRVRTLETYLKSVERDQLNSIYVKKVILELRDDDPDPPSWLVTKPQQVSKSIGVPTLFASDWHWGEVVDPKQIGGVNEYNLSIAHERAKRIIKRTIDLCFNHITLAKYPGIVFALGGDLFSGNIHDDLNATNENEIMPLVIDLYGVLIWCINTLKEHFGKVFIPCVAGNHGRTTPKIRTKDMPFTNFDWLLYQFLNKHFEDDKSVNFLIPDGTDAYYKIYNYRYLLTHGNLFKGGDGLIGPLGPITRGDHKKRSRNSQIGLDYDTMLVAHFHQLMMLKRLIVNSSLKGYDEYAYQGNFIFEEPQQALWITHIERGITMSFPVQAGDKKKQQNSVSQWVSWK